MVVQESPCLQQNPRSVDRSGAVREHGKEHMFGRLLGKKKLAPAKDELVRLSPAISTTILETVGAKSIPTMPGAAQKAFQLATDPSAEAHDFVEVIQSDEALSARVIKIANSVFFDRGTGCTTIEDAVVIIGINELRCLLNATSLSEIFPCRHSARTQLWANDIAVALISRSLAERYAPQQVELAFLAGLMHDVGKLLLLQRIPEEYGKVLQQVEREGADFCLIEAEHFPFTHVEAGQLIAERWNFGPELVTVIRHHHEPFDAPAVTPLIAIVKAADTIAHALGLGHPKGFARLRNHAEERLPEVWRHFGIPEEEQRETLARFQRRYDTEYDLYANRALS